MLNFMFLMIMSKQIDPHEFKVKLDKNILKKLLDGISVQIIGWFML